MITSCLKRLQERYGEAVDREIESKLAPRHLTETFYGMMRYQLGYVDERLQPAATTSAKRFRPALCLLACEAVGGPPERALGTAACIELLHNFSLIHDDIEDQDPSRRYRPTVWKVWGEPQAINAGDGMFALANRVVLESGAPPQVSLMLARGFQQTALELTEGQYMDMNFEQRQDVTPGEYMQMISLKTGALTAFSAWSGALLGGGSGQTCSAFHTYGQELGRAFQIRDDILGIWAGSDETGKEEAKDLHNRKKTLPILIASERADPESSEVLSRFFQRRHDDLGSILRVLADTSARALAEEGVQRHLTSALAALRQAEIPPAACSELEQLARELTGQ